MKVRAYMTSTVLVAQATDSAREALENMALGDVRHLPVVDDEGRLQGVVSDRDLRLPAWAASAAGSEAAFEALTVGEVMTGFAVSVSPDADLLEAARIFVELRFGVVPVVDEDGELQGMLSAMDVLQAFLDMAPGDDTAR